MHSPSPPAAPFAEAKEREPTGTAGAAVAAVTVETAFEQHVDALYRFMRRMGGEPAPAWLETATASVWRTLAAPDAPAPSPARVYAAACAELARWLPAAPATRPGRVPPAGIDAEAALSAWMQLRAGSVQRSPEGSADLALWRQLGDELVNALGDLPFGPRAAVLLHQDVGLLHSQIGEVLNEPPDVARRWVWLGLMHLRCCGGAVSLRRAAHG